MRCVVLSCLLWLYPAPSRAESKHDLLIEVIQTAKDFRGISSIVEIIKSYPEVYRSIPHQHPLGHQTYYTSSVFGYRTHPISKERTFHRGVDFASEYANKVHATADGVVTYSGEKKGYGKLVIVEHAHGFNTYYAHLTYIYTRQGRKVKAGHVIGFVGSTGQSTGNHLHYEVRKNQVPINPTPFIGW